MNKLQEDLLGNVLEIGAGLANAFVVLIKASPIILIGYILFIAPNC